MRNLPPSPSSGRFLFSPQLPSKRSGDCTQLSTYTAPDALSQVEKLSGCSVVRLLRINSADESDGDDIALHNSQLRVALAELLGIHHEHAKQAAGMLHTIQQQYHELALLKEQMAQTEDSLMLENADDREHQIQRQAQHRVTSYCEQATASSLALDQAAVSCKQLQLQLSSTNEAHALEQQSLNSELRLLRDRGAALDAKVSQLCERVAKAEQQLIYSEEQLASTQAAARSEATELLSKLADSRQQVREGQEQAQIMREALETRRLRLENAETDLKHATVQLEELQSRVQWYESHLQELQAAQTQQKTDDAIHLRDTSPAHDSQSPCALPPPASSNVHPDSSYPQALPRKEADHRRLHNESLDQDRARSETGAHACSEDGQSHQTLKDLLDPSDGASTPHCTQPTVQIKAHRRSNEPATTGAPPQSPACGGNNTAASWRNSCSTISFEDGENTPLLDAGAESQSDTLPPQMAAHKTVSRGHQEPLPQTASVSTRALRVANQKTREAPFSTDPHSPGSVPLGKSLRAAASARTRTAGAPTSFGRADNQGAEGTRDCVTQTSHSTVKCAPEAERTTCDACHAPPETESGGPSGMHASPSPENFRPAGFGTVPDIHNSLKSPPPLGGTRRLRVGEDRTDGVREVAAAAAAAASSAVPESAPREPLLSITNQEVGKQAASLHEPATSPSGSAKAPFPSVLEGSGACMKLQGTSKGAHSSTLVQQSPTQTHGYYARKSGEFQVSASVQDLAARLKDEHMRNEALLFALKQHTASNSMNSGTKTAPNASCGHKRHHAPDSEPPPTRSACRTTTTTTADVGVQMVHSHVFALDAIIQCKISEDERPQNCTICSICGGSAAEALEGELTLALGLTDQGQQQEQRQRSQEQPTLHEGNGTTDRDRGASCRQLVGMTADLKQLHEDLKGSMEKLSFMHGSRKFLQPALAPALVLQDSGAGGGALGAAVAGMGGGGALGAAVAAAEDSGLLADVEVEVEVASQGSSSSLGLSSMHLRMDDMDILLQEDSVLEALVAGLVQDQDSREGASSG